MGVDGTGPFSFQWRRDGVNVAGATSAVLTLPSVALQRRSQFSVVVSNSAGSGIKSSAARRHRASCRRRPAPTITSQPSTLIVPSGGSGVLAVGATGSGPLSYQWSKAAHARRDHARAGLPERGRRRRGTYTVTVSNSMGSVVSAKSTSSARRAGDHAATRGRDGARRCDATFFVAGEQLGPALPVVVNGNPIPGAIGTTYNTPVVDAANSGAVYSVHRLQRRGRVSARARCSRCRLVPPTVTQHPQNVTIEAGRRRDLCELRRHADVRRAAATLERIRMDAGLAIRPARQPQACSLRPRCTRRQRRAVPLRSTMPVRPKWTTNTAP